MKAKKDKKNMIRDEKTGKKYNFKTHKTKQRIKLKINEQGGDGYSGSGELI
jgi:hypothetical protein